MTTTTRRTFILNTAALATTAFISGNTRAADEPLLIRCSLDTAPSHGRNKAFQDYLAKLESQSGGRIKTKLYESGQLFKDLEIPKALLQNQVEMACPGSWAITGIVPDADAFQLPILYGRSADDVHHVFDNDAGKLINAKIEEKLRAHVMGPWIDLGYENWYSTKTEITGLASLKGLKVRNSGGPGQAWRAKFVGAIPNTTAWPSVPLSLSQGVFDTLVSTNESLVTAQLWDAGVKYAYEDHQFFAMYIPMISTTFWAKLTPDLQKLMTSLWAENITAYRAHMADAQTKARVTLQSHNVKFIDPTADQLAADRKRMMPEQEALAKELKLSPDVVKFINAGFASA